MLNLPTLVNCKSGARCRIIFATTETTYSQKNIFRITIHGRHLVYTCLALEHIRLRYRQLFLSRTDTMGTVYWQDDLEVLLKRRPRFNRNELVSVERFLKPGSSNLLTVSIVPEWRSSILISPS